MSNFKKERIQDKQWLAFAKEMNCMFCRVKNDTVIMHHIRAGGGGGMGMKPSDNLVVPTCFLCHSEIERIGEIPFYKQYNFTVPELKSIAINMYERYIYNKSKNN